MLERTEFFKRSHVRLCEWDPVLSTARGPGALEPDMYLRALPTLSLVFHVIYTPIQVSGIPLKYGTYAPATCRFRVPTPHRISARMLNALVPSMIATLSCLLFITLSTSSLLF